MANTSIELLDAPVASMPAEPPLPERCDILFVVGQLSCGGTERQLSLLTTRLAARGYRVTVAVSVSRSVEKFLAPIEAHSKIVRLDADLGASRKFQRAIRLRKLVKQLQPGVVHSMSFRTNWLAAFACFMSPSVSVGSFRNDFDFCRMRYGRMLGAINSRWPKLQVFNSISSATKARDHRGLFSPRIVEFVRNAVGLIPEQTAPAERGTEEVTILGIGRLSEPKRWDRLIHLAAKLNSSGRRIRVWLAGDGPLRAQLESEVTRCDVGEIFTFHGEVSDVSQLLHDCDIVVHTSTVEGTPNALMEAMAAGKPVVTTDVGDANNIIGDGQAGFVVDQGNRDMLFEKTCQLIDGPELRVVLGMHGRSVALREFGTERMVDSMLRVYRSAGWSGCAKLCE